MYRLLLFGLLTLGYLRADASPAEFEIGPPKIITINIEPGGRVFMGPDTIYVAGLAADLQERLWKSWLSTGKMYESIKVNFRGEVLMGVKGAALDAIKEAQNKTLTEVCLEKYKVVFENLSAKQKQRLKKQFPVLFQEMHW